MMQLIKKIKQISVLLLVMSFVGCNNDDDNNYPEVLAGFTYTINLETGTVVFINTSESSDSYEWDFGDDNSSNEINPVNTYSTSGTYTVVLTAKNVAGGSDTFESIITFTILEKNKLPMTFDDENVIYEAAVFNGATFEIIDNPSVSGTNNKASKVGAITNGGTEWEGINFDVGVDIDLTVNKTITMNLWADTATTVLMKLEEGTGADIEVSSAHGGTGWELISFDFNSSNQYSRLTLFVDGPGTTAGTFYIDDIEQVLSAPVITLIGSNPMNVVIGGTFNDPGATAIDGNGTDISSNIVIAGDTVDANTAGTYTITYNVSDEEGNVAIEVTRTVIVANDTVAPIINLIGSDPMNVELGAAFTDPGATATDNVDGDITSSIIIGGDTVDVNTAATYIITYNVNDTAGNPATQVTRTVIVAAAGACTAESTESMNASDLNVTFMSDQTANIRNDNAVFEWVDNPGTDAVNNSCKVGKVTKQNVQPWDNIQIDFNEKFDLSANGGFKMNVYSANPGYTVLLKLESIDDPDTNTEIDLTTTKTNEWEELTYNFSTSEDNKYNRIVLIFDLSVANTNTYYFDDLKLFARTDNGGGSPGDYNLSLPIDFESDGFGAQWSWNVFENDDNPPLEFVNNPNASGINTSSSVAKVTARQTGAPWVGTETAHGEMGITWDLSSSNSIIKIMVYKTVISDVGIKLVNPSGGAQAEIKVANTKINEWEELTFDFSSRIGNGLDGSTNIDQIVVFPDFSDPRTAETITYFDNITFN